MSMGNGALERSGTWVKLTLGQMGTWVLWHVATWSFRQMGTWANFANRQLGTWAIWERENMAIWAHVHLGKWVQYHLHDYYLQNIEY